MRFTYKHNPGFTFTGEQHLGSVKSSQEIVFNFHYSYAFMKSISCEIHRLISPLISINILQTVFYPFLVVLVGRFCSSFILMSRMFHDVVKS